MQGIILFVEFRKLDYFVYQLGYLLSNHFVLIEKLDRGGTDGSTQFIDTYKVLRIDTMFHSRGSESLQPFLYSSTEKDVTVSL